jgi:hypothetical protein
MVVRRPPFPLPIARGMLRGTVIGNQRRSRMPKRKGKIPRITVGPVNPIDLTEKNWREIESAYGKPIPQLGRTQITEVTGRFLRRASAEKTGLMEEATQRATEMRDQAQALDDVINRRATGDSIREYVDDTIAFAYGVSNYDDSLPARNYISHFLLELSRFRTSCELARREFDDVGQ